MGTCTAGMVFLANLYPKDMLGRISGLTQMSLSTGLLVGPAVGGWLYEYHGFRAPFWLNAGLYAAQICLFLVVVPGTHKSQTTPLSKHSAGSGYGTHLEADELPAAVPVPSPRRLSRQLAPQDVLLRTATQVDVLMVGCSVGALASAASGVETALPLYLKATLNFNSDYTGYSLCGCSLCTLTGTRTSMTSPV